MNRFIWIIGLLAALNADRSAVGHGTPIEVQAGVSALSVNGGLLDDDGYAPNIFVEDDEDGDPFGTFTLPSVGPVVIWQLPGLEISGMDEQSSLSIEVLTRPAKDLSATDRRLVWYWNPQTEVVTAAPAALHLLGTGQRFTTLLPNASTAPPPFLLADPIAGHQGFHNHGLLSYALDNDPGLPTGAYGFFARFNSDEYSPSNPFLVVLNFGVDYEAMTSAALAINAAAFLPGDYNHNDRVDAADYVVWRDTLGSTTELAADGSGNQEVDGPDHGVWRGNFGATTGGPGSWQTSVPEPCGPALMCVALWGWLIQLSLNRVRRDRSFSR